MKLNKEDLNVFKTPLIGWLKNEYKIDIEKLTLQLKEFLYIDMDMYYKGLKIHIDATSKIYSEHGSVVIEILEGQAKNKYLVFQLIDFMKPLIKETSYFRMDINKLIFSFDGLRLPINIQEVKIVDEEILIDL